MTVILPQFHPLWLWDVWMTEFWIFFKFPSIVRIYAWFFFCKNHHSDSDANHVNITPLYAHDAQLPTPKDLFHQTIFLITWNSFGTHEPTWVSCSLSHLFPFSFLHIFFIPISLCTVYIEYPCDISWYPFLNELRKDALDISHIVSCSMSWDIQQQYIERLT